MSECVFCKIVKGDVAAQRVFENDKTVAILDINPVTRGHALVLSKAHHVSLPDLPPDLAGELMKAAQIVARGVMKAEGAPGCNLLMNNDRCSGQAIDHAHIHVIPRKKDDGVKYNWLTKTYDGDTMEKVAQGVRDALK